MAAWLRRHAGVGYPPVRGLEQPASPRVVEFCRKYGLDCITHAKKPFSSAAFANV